MTVENLLLTMARKGNSKIDLYVPRNRRGRGLHQLINHGTVSKILAAHAGNPEPSYHYDRELSMNVISFSADSREDDLYEIVAEDVRQTRRKQQ